MKKKIAILTAVVIGFCAISAFLLNSKSNVVSALELFSVEALARGESVTANGPGESVYCAAHFTYHVSCKSKNDKSCEQTTH